MKNRSINDVKRDLLRFYSLIAFSLAALIYLSFALYLVINEDRNTAVHLQSFKNIAIERYQNSGLPYEKVSPFISAYYDIDVLPDTIKEMTPLPINEVSNNRNFLNEGYFVFYTRFLDSNSKDTALYLTIDAGAKDFGDESWDFIILISMAFTGCLILVLRFSLKRVFSMIMSPISELSTQLTLEGAHKFQVEDDAIVELQHLTERLNQFSDMKERIAKQEMMFAKYASHELKTPIAIILGAANLQGMKQEPEFHEKQRVRIVSAAKKMQATVEVLLNIVKQENVGDVAQLYSIQLDAIDIASYQRARPDIKFDLELDPNTQTNLPPTVLSMILKNLLDNSIRHTDEGKIDVLIQAETIRVRDTGSGLDGKTISEHGLGLLIVRRLCESYQWSFSIANHPQGGCIAELKRHIE
ncbi:sensor histidine kinase [Vibrio penaeicida]|uniref:sensor histidine kinase n=1 Tax=Vibrio penaeicida TaxID=104609 RepID=UPI001F36AA64|nr:HAMP domain-containing sensor histidine kinase [Vibrio penaeicida]